jgi:hypothetical protein
MQGGTWLPHGAQRNAGIPNFASLHLGYGFFRLFMISSAGQAAFLSAIGNSSTVPGGYPPFLV